MIKCGIRDLSHLRLVEHNFVTASNPVEFFNMPKNELQKIGISLCVGVSSFKLSMPVNLSILKSQHGNRMR